MCAHFPTYSQCQILYCYTCGLLYAGATQGELPERQEKVPWGIPVLRNSVVWCLRTAPVNSSAHAQQQGEHTVLPHRRQPGADKRFCRCMIHFCFKMQRDISFRKNLCYTETR